MVATSQPLASQTGLDILKRGGNAVDAAIAMAAVLNVTEPNMTGIGGDAFMMVYSAKTKKLEALNASGRAPRALTAEHFAVSDDTQMPFSGMETITVPGAFDGWMTLLEKHGTMKLPDLLAPAIALAENGFPVMEKTVADWIPEVEKLRRTPAAASTYLVNGAAPQPGAIFVQKNLARTFRTLATGRPRRVLSRRDRPGHRRLLPEERRLSDDGGFRGSTSPTWVEPISTTYRGHTLYEFPPNNQGLTALLLLNILEGIDLTSMRNDPVRYYHTLIEATKIAFADRNRYIADPAFAKVPVQELLSKDYAAKRRALIDPRQGDRSAGLRRGQDGQRHHLFHGRRQGPQRRVVHQQHLQLVRLRRSSPARPASCCTIAAPASSLAGRPSEPPRARQAAVPHADSGDGVQGRPAADVVRRHGRRHPGPGTRTGARST